MVELDIAAYPHSEKIGLFAGAAPGGPQEERILQKYLRADAEVGDYDGEE